MGSYYRVFLIQSVLAYTAVVVRERRGVVAAFPVVCALVLGSDPESRSSSRLDALWGRWGILWEDFSGVITFWPPVEVPSAIELGAEIQRQTIWHGRPPELDTSQIFKT